MDKDSLNVDPEILSSAEGQLQDITLDATARNIALINHAIESIGFGKYQIRLFFTCGFGFFVDQMLAVSVGLVLPQITKQWDTKYPSMLTAALYSGSLVGALGCGHAADMIGRRLVWQISLFVVTIFTMIAAASPNFAALAAFIGLQMVGGGGNIALDLTVFIEWLPNSKDYMLTALGMWFGVGNAVGGLLAWPLIIYFSCPVDATPATCSNAENMGWRYQYILIGGLCFVLAVIRVFFMKMEESTKWLVSQGRFEEAIDSLRKVAETNNSELPISSQDFYPIADTPQVESRTQKAQTQLSHIRSLFVTRKLGISTTGVILLWTAIGIAYPLYTLFLPIYLQTNGANLGSGSTFQTYRDYCISSSIGILGPILSTLLVNVRFLGRRRSMALTAICAGAFAGAFTTVRSEGANIAFSSLVNFWQHGYYAILYSYTPEVMPTASRGTGCGTAVAFGRLASLASPFVATFADTATSVPIWVCLGLYVFSGVVALGLPFEPRHFDDEERF
ncbi:sugar transporter [Aspergillus steynii IBT 23096]|uniref:Sugar transporter n=1 Tax=Aspergillus steynii IBT 23096 TaxID=1392250 RepID=A0A2I2GJL9_9EURO|nr:sugar transporter [Aspergillus steynii IBT 23096]PLB53076.1 sugar transporter [Aspergillus steynii IBT 23096]